MSDLDRLIGHGAAEARLAAASASGRIHHAWLFAGPQGIGKGLLARRFARFLLAGDGGAGAAGLFGAPTDLSVDPNHPAARLIEVGSHPDLLLLEPVQAGESKRERRGLVIEQIRKIADFLHLTPSLGAFRIVILDPVDALNLNAANALLKVLEEPPARTVMLLVASEPGRLLATIRSRCQRLDLASLGADEFARVIDRFDPPPDPTDRPLIDLLAEGSPGRALRLIELDGLALYREIQALLGAPRLDWARIHGLADRLSGAVGEPRLILFADLIAGIYARAARLGGLQRPRDPLSEDLEARLGLAGLARLWDKTQADFRAAFTLNLDPRQAVLGTFAAFEAEAASGAAVPGRG